MKSKWIRIASVTLWMTAFAGLTVRAHAQNGCVNSPENPTAVLGVVATAAAAFTARRARLK
jgi:hypothetical protein